MGYSSGQLTLLSFDCGLWGQGQLDAHRSFVCQCGQRKSRYWTSSLVSERDHEGPTRDSRPAIALTNLLNGCIGWKHNPIWTDVCRLCGCSPHMPPYSLTREFSSSYAENDPVVLDYFHCRISVSSNERRFGLFSKGYSGSFYCWYQGWMCLLSVGVRVKLMIPNHARCLQIYANLSQQKNIRDHSSGTAIQGDIVFIGKKRPQEIWAATVWP